MIELSYNLILPGILTGLVGLFSYYTVKIYLLRQKYMHIPGPPTNGILGFYFGNVPDFLKNRETKRVNNDLIGDWLHLYGKTIKYQALNEIIILTVDQKAIKEIMIDRNMPKAYTYSLLGYPFGQRFLGNGLVTDQNYERWKHRRTLYNPVFHKQVLMGFINEFNLKSDHLLEKLRKYSDGKTSLSMMDEFSRTALDVISHVAFGMETDALNNSENKLNYYIAESFRGYQKYVETVYFLISRFYPSTYAYKKFYKNIIKNLRQVGDDQIMNRLKLIKEDSYVPSDLLSITLKNFENEEINLEDMIDDFITFFIAGQETTANTLSFCIIELSKNPSIVKKMRDEIDTVLGDRNEITYEDLSGLNYISCVIKETLRLWPPANGTVRKVDTDDFLINGLKIPKHTTVHISPYNCGKYSGNFNDPMKFSPERFMNNENEINAYNYMPFSLGPRNCIGQNFAKIEMKIILAKLVQNFDFILEENQNLWPVEYATFRPADGAKCFVTLRNA